MSYFWTSARVYIVNDFRATIATLLSVLECGNITIIVVRGEFTFLFRMFYGM